MAVSGPDVSHNGGVRSRCQVQMSGPDLVQMCPICVYRCVPYVSICVYICVPYVSHMCPICVPYVSHMFQMCPICPRCVPYSSKACASRTSSISRLDCTPTLFFRVMNRLSKDFRVHAEQENSCRITIHCNTRYLYH